MARVLEDSKRNPGAFCWFGTIPSDELEAWIKRSGIKLPADLLEFWRVTGGGELFESETILRPDVPSRPNASFIAGDDTVAANEGHRANGTPDHFLVFQTGAFFSAIDLRTMEFVTLDESKTYAITARFASLEEWYVHTLRAEFASRYGLDSLSSG